ncbi:UDP-N-acetylmuramate--L-alanine ligase [Candidatus Pandoraea novymonadis]|uniref:UDP-N-acetylmuramate--L-alanine ligase n=1 Tax=Candidatus Pandoraea novymonadis TaxID=1808959 RepID=A0ABX5FFA7_9BURK|nr:UDP-N-acetylmuramate--L-alanine ligase [Candidatus Pandoraea novymonadis]PSB92394.1 UDP-N-acetylmuramate--L-alanine ligase [Candidatus Pandoraea novymonadis]
MKHSVKHIHFVGIGGAGMSGIAQILLNLGYQVSGSDLAATRVTQRLIDLGARVIQGHAAENIQSADAIVVSTAIGPDNPEILAGRIKQIPIVSRTVMLAELMRLKKGIAIAGTHGKTTTTSLMASVLVKGGFDPTFVVGGHLNSTGENARLGVGDFIVVEADESDASFLKLSPVIEVITNIDFDHMDSYGHDFVRLKQAFLKFTERLPFYGIAVLCVDDPYVREILPFVSRQVIRYGFSEEAQVRAIDIHADGGQMHFTALREYTKGLAPLDITLNLPGYHNVQNSLAVIAIATELGVSDFSIRQAFLEFNGVSRRFQRYGEINLQKNSGAGSFTLIDDYGHHPVEIAATLRAARAAFPGRRIILAFQPHRYTRLRDCFADFVKVLSTPDILLLAEVYAAGEVPIVAVDSLALEHALRMAHQIELVFVGDVSQIPDALLKVARAGDVVITMGAGSIDQVPHKLLEQKGV